ncbi:5'-3' exoribonuclease 1 (Strand-exchange protein 1 homolog) [Durusdinium trenchii]|uniref:5'-3' exoribonuclease 1 (Strand-exchange protein 1 homolog) n=1 Tax=Durusdinium trenchii TaxID=1381693 RepID=A0ABP0HGJ7_9DINO
MGIPRFYRWLSERYPLINENITAEQIPDFDNLYLDMNGIIHNCSHNNTGGLCQKEESDVFVEAFSYICRLVQIIRPKKILYMAVDGCAPRAKMNQQRSRRFRAANDAREAKDLALQMGEDISGPHFDSNCITPGTEFMAKLTEHLRFFICKKIQEDPAWQSFTVVLSGPETAGEGEHKIMDYIRKAKAQPDHDPNTRHCLYGLDADLIMLSLASHEPHFALLREEVVFGRRETKTTDQRMLIAKDRFQLLHVSLLREYLDIEFAPQIEPKFHNLERIIDDFILFCVLVGNDFLPCLPFAEIGQHGLEDLFRVYKDHLASSSASSSFWLTKNCGEVDFKQFSKFLKKYGELEDGHLQSACDEQEFTLGKQRLVGLEEAPAPKEYAPDLPIEPPPTSEMAREQWYEVKFAMDVNDYEGTQIPFIDPERLLLAMEQAFNQGPPLSSEEKKRDEFRMAKSFQYDMKAGVFVKSTVPRKYGDIQRCPVRINEFQHLALPGEHFPNYLLSGVRTKEMGFPTLHEIPFTTSFQVGVKVFQFEAKGLSMYLHLRPTSPFEPTEEEYRKRGLTVEFDSSAIAVGTMKRLRVECGEAKQVGLRAYRIAGDLSENELCQQPAQTYSWYLTGPQPGQSCGDDAKYNGDKPGVPMDGWWTLTPAEEMKRDAAIFVSELHPTGRQWNASNFMTVGKRITQPLAALEAGVSVHPHILGEGEQGLLG